MRKDCEQIQTDAVMSTNRRIARNTIMLYVRMLCSVCINLYASRILLSTLGVDDFGVYNIVGGVVAMLSFLNSTMSGCTSRFLTYELGKGDNDRLVKTFSSAFLIHIYIAVFILLAGETLGLWFVNTQLVIPESRVAAANVVYQFSLLSAAISFIQVPYSADVIAHERMDAYAYVEIIHVLLKLGAILLLPHLPFDRLMTYAVLLTCVSLAVFVTYRMFCVRHFEESRFRRPADRSVMMPMLKFTSLDIYGNLCVVTQQQGANVLINRFFGVALNAASGVATQASSIVSMFVSSFTMALRPPVIKKYASGDFEGLQRLFTVALVLCSSLAVMMCVPLYLRINYLMTLWLGDVPAYAVQFCKWLLLANSVTVVNTLFNTLIHATGNIKRLSLISGTLYLTTVLFSYFAFRFSSPPQATYAIFFIIAIVVLVSNSIIAKKQIPELLFGKLAAELLMPAVSLTIAVLSSSFLNGLLPDGLWGTVLLFIVNALVAVLSLYCLWIGPRYGWNIKNIIRKDEI